MSLTSFTNHLYANEVVLVRADLNLPLRADGSPLSKHRLAAVTQTIRCLIDGNARVLLLTHLGRPTEQDDALSTRHLVPILKRALPGVNVVYVADCVGEAVHQALASVSPASVVLLENVRFHPHETANDAAFAAALAQPASCFVFDAFAVAHRRHASTAGVAAAMRMRGLPVSAGLLVERETAALTSVLTTPKRPFLAIVGGSKLASKADALQALVRVADVVALVGGVAVPFVRRDGDGRRNLVTLIRDQARHSSTLLVTPVDVVVSDCQDSDTSSILPESELRQHHSVVDVGPSTLSSLGHHINAANTILWNGPAGTFETPPHDHGTRNLIAMLSAATRRGATTVVGGGHTVAAVERCGADACFSHVSTGGGAMLAMVEGQRLPGLDALVGSALACVSPQRESDFDSKIISNLRRGPLAETN